MKKIKSFLAFALLCLIATPLFLAAQGTAPEELVVNALVDAVVIKSPIVGTVGTVLFLVSELLASNKKIAANSVFQLVSGFLKKAFGK